MMTSKSCERAARAAVNVNRTTRKPSRFMRRLKNRQRVMSILFRGAHAPTRAYFGALAETVFMREKFAIAGARSPAREARALPGIGIALPHQFVISELFL